VTPEARTLYSRLDVLDVLLHFVEPPVHVLLMGQEPSVEARAVEAVGEEGELFVKVVPPDLLEELVAVLVPLGAGRWHLTARAHGKVSRLNRRVPALLGGVPDLDRVLPLEPLARFLPGEGEEVVGKLCKALWAGCRCTHRLRVGESPT